MSYVVRPLPEVTEELAEAPRSVQDHFQRIMAVIAMNPFPNPQFPLLTEDIAADGRRILTYSDQYFPYSIQLVVMEETDEADGAVLVLSLRRHRTNGE